MAGIHDQVNLCNKTVAFKSLAHLMSSSCFYVIVRGFAINLYSASKVEDKMTLFAIQLFSFLAKNVNIAVIRYILSCLKL